MARIRSIKPEFWTSEQIADCSPTARLLFIGLWTFSDDNGIHPASTRRLKMEVFPADDVTAEQVGALVGELIAARLVVEYEVSGQRFWEVTGWHHQKIEKPTYRFPLRPVDDHSESPRRPIDEPSGTEWSGVESSREEQDTPHTQPLPTAGGMDSADARAARVGSPSAPGNQNGKPSAASGTEPTDDDPPVPATVAAPRPRSGPSGAGNAKSPSMPPHGPPGRIARTTDDDLQPWFEAACRGLGQSLTWGPRYVMPTERVVVHAEKHGLTVDQVEAVARHYRVRCRDGTPSFPKFADDIDRWRADWQASRSGGKAPPKTPAQLRAKGVCPEHPGEKLTPAGRCELCDEVALLRKRLGDGSTEAVA